MLSIMDDVTDSNYDERVRRFMANLDAKGVDRRYQQVMRAAYRAGYDDGYQAGAYDTINEFETVHA